MIRLAGLLLILTDQGKSDCADVIVRLLISVFGVVTDWLGFHEILDGNSKFERSRKVWGPLQRMLLNLGYADTVWVWGGYWLMKRVGTANAIRF